MAISVKKIQWGTQIEVKSKIKSPSKEIQKIVPINFSMLYLDQHSEIGNNEIPDHLVVKYSEDYNILEIDLIIKKRFETMKKKSVEQLLAKIKGEEIKLTKPRSAVERKSILALKKDLEKELDEIQNDILRDRYLIQSNNLIEQYKKLGIKRKVLNFTGDKGTTVLDNDNNDDSDDSDLRQEIVSRYLEIARKYIEIDIIRIVENDRGCPGCNLPEDEMVLEEYGIQKCPNCGIERILTTGKVTSSFSSSSNPDQEMNSGIRNNYNDADTFFKGLLRFQGKQANKLPINLMTCLDSYFSNLGLPVGEEIKKSDTLEDGSKPGTSYSMMIKALQEKGFTDCYEDLNLICHLYWGWTLPDISHLEEIIMDDYNRTQKVFECIKKGKKSSLNGEYRRFKHLELRWDKCRIEMFRIIKTRETLERAEQLWEQMCQGAGLKFIPTI